METAKLTLGAMLSHCGRLGGQQMDKNLRPYTRDITPVQCWAIGFILRAAEAGRSVSQRDLERQLRLKAPTVNGVVERLEQKGYLLRRQSEIDGRCKLLLPTDRARAFHTAFERAAEQTEARMVSGFTPQERQLLLGMLERIAENLQAEEETHA